MSCVFVSVIISSGSHYQDITGLHFSLLNQSNGRYFNWYWHGPVVEWYNVPARLCMIGSPLNEHLCPPIHMVSQLECVCGHIRENKHIFFLTVFFIATNRITWLLNGLGFEALLNNLLYGNSMYTLKKQTNKHLWSSSSL